MAAINERTRVVEIYLLLPAALRRRRGKEEHWKYKEILGSRDLSKKENNLKESVQEQAQAQKNSIANMHEVSTSASTRKKTFCLSCACICLTLVCL